MHSLEAWAFSSDNVLAGQCVAGWGSTWNCCQQLQHMYGKDLMQVIAGVTLAKCEHCILQATGSHMMLLKETKQELLLCCLPLRCCRL